MTPTTFGKYLVVRTLGAGGMGEVFVARDPALNRMVAIKAVHAHLAADPTFGARFQREAKIIAQLDHPNIVPVYDFDGAHSPPYMVMPLVSGRSLRERMNDRRAAGDAGLPVPETLKILDAVAAALDAAHRKGVIHRDIKPGNVLLAEDGAIRLTDFGIAKLVDESANTMQLSMPDSTIGTAAYMSPEQALGGEVGPRSDIYSLGAMLFEMVTGRPPFQGGSATAVMLMHMASPVPNACDIDPRLPAAAGTVIARALAKKPEDRFTTTRELADSFAAALAGASRAEPGVSPDEIETAVDGPRSSAVASASAAMSAPPEAVTARHALTEQPRVVPAPVLAPDLGKPLGQPTTKRPWLVPAAGAAALTLIVAAVLALRGTPATTVPTASPPAATLQLAASPTPGSTAAGPVKAPAAVTTAPRVVTAVPPTPVPAPRFGEVHLAAGADSADVRLDNVAQPVSGTQYVLWMGDGPSLRRIGTLTVENSRIRQSFVLPAAPLDGLARIRITYESSPSASVPSARVAFAAEVGDKVLPALAALQSGTPEASQASTAEVAEAELAIAMEHHKFMLAAMQLGDMKNMRRHAEHVINTIEGKTGPLFGDRDGSGVAENPGDDIGVKVHVANLRARAPERSWAAFDSITVALQGSIELVVKVLSVDKPADALKFAQQSAALLASLSADGGGALAAAAGAIDDGGVDVVLIRGAAYPQLPAVVPDDIPDDVIAAFKAINAAGSGQLAKADAQYGVAAEHMQYMARSVAAGNVAESRGHGEHIANILEGKARKPFGDINGDGRTDDPGDGIGVAGYIVQAASAVPAARAGFYGAQFTANSARTLELLDAAASTSAKIASADTKAEIDRLFPALREQFTAVQEGQDRDKDGVIEPLVGEGGLRSMQSMAAAIASP